MPASQPQIDKIVSVVQPLYSDADFSGVSEIKVVITQTPPSPSVEVDEIPVNKI